MWCLVSDKPAIPLHVKKQVITGKSDRKSTRFYNHSKITYRYNIQTNNAIYKKLILFTLGKSKETSVQLKTKLKKPLPKIQQSQPMANPIS